MLKKNITYQTYNDPPETLTETFYFHLRLNEFKDLIDEEGDTNDFTTLIAQVDELVLRAYGVKSEDGKEFDKSPELRDAFAKSAAYEALLSELAFTDDNFLVFLRGVLPKEALAEFNKVVISSQTNGAPLAPPPVPEVSSIPKL